MSKVTLKDALPLSKQFLDFVSRAVSPWHAVEEVRSRLLKEGFEHLSEKSSWTLKRNGRYFVTRNNSSIVTFAVGGNFKSGNGFKIIGAHTDSPDLKLKPVSAQKKEGMLQVGVQTYGGGLWYTWFDRDLTIAGRVIVEKDKQYTQHLVNLKKPILRIPSLAIHLNRGISENGFKFNEETNLLPVIASCISEQLEGGDKKEEKKEEKHHQLLLDMISTELGCKSGDIRDFDLSVIDTQAPVIGGANDEFIFSPRLDNLMSCFTSLDAFINTLNSVNSDTDIRLLCYFDHEEIGSKSSHGAGSSLMADIIKRVNLVLADKDTPKDYYDSCIAKSFIISSDMAHAVHPNYGEKHHDKHKPMMHCGPVIKYNSNQRYATTAHTAFVIKELCKRNDIPVQEFVVRNDSPCGSTIGPILASGLGIKTVDIGAPMWSMHSIRETCATVDVVYSSKLFTAFFTQYNDLEKDIKIDE
jgi:aspartyl aminopeptidase